MERTWCPRALPYIRQILNQKFFTPFPLSLSSKGSLYLSRCTSMAAVSLSQSLLPTCLWWPGPWPGAWNQIRKSRNQDILQGPLNPLKICSWCPGPFLYFHKKLVLSLLSYKSKVGQKKTQGLKDFWYGPEGASGNSRLNLGLGVGPRHYKHGSCFPLSMSLSDVPLMTWLDLAHDPVPGAKFGKAETKTSSRGPWIPLKYVPGAQDPFSTSTKNWFSLSSHTKARWAKKKPRVSKTFDTALKGRRVIFGCTWGLGLGGGWGSTAFTFSCLGGLCRSCRGLSIVKVTMTIPNNFFHFLKVGRQLKVLKFAKF